MPSAGLVDVPELTLTEARERVATSAELLRGYYCGNRWRALVDTSRLDMRSTRDCVLGQLFGSLSNGCHAFGELVFEPAFAFDGGSDEANDVLTQAWREQLDNNNS